VEQEDFKGYDPYDVQNSVLPIGNLPHSLKFITTQIVKRSPINLRKVLGVKKNYHTKAMGIYLSAYCNLYRLTKDESYIKSADFIFNWLKNNQSGFSANPCWGFDYPYTSRVGSVEKNFPTVIHHSFILKGIYNYFRLTGSTEASNLIRAADAFILEELPITTFPQGICLGYHPGAHGCCYNASLHAAASLAVVSQLKKDSEYLDWIEPAVQYAVSRQKPSGVWYYSHGNYPDIEKKQIDFHQGFILDSLSEIENLTGGQMSGLIQPAIQAGLAFYYSRQFDEKGRSMFRLPSRFPVDIHNQAQGIITFSRFGCLDEKYAAIADAIVQWTIRNMQDPQGFFYYQQYRFFTNKISYIRWGQAWMLLALTEYLLMRQGGPKE